MVNLVVRALSHVLVPLFLLGMAGSAIVVAITVVHDVRDFFSDNGDERKVTDSLS